MKKRCQGCYSELGVGGWWGRVNWSGTGGGRARGIHKIKMPLDLQRK